MHVMDDHIQHVLGEVEVVREKTIQMFVRHLGVFHGIGLDDLIIVEQHLHNCYRIWLEHEGIRVSPYLNITMTPESIVVDLRVM